jgi:hypothetical protein
MTKDDIIRMAREAGLCDEYGTVNYEYGYLEEILKFAQLVAAAERDTWMERAAILIRGEREACAKVCEEEICGCCWDEQAEAAAEHLAETIRARGNT